MVCMYVIDVIPLIRGSHVESLTYYVGTEYSAGTIVTIPIRKKEVRGLVTECKPVGAAKTAVRTATFSLRKLPDQLYATPLPSTLVAAAYELTKTTPTTIGAALYALLPPEVREGTQMLASDQSTPQEIDAVPAVSVLQGLAEERFRVYRSQIRAAFAHRGSVLFVVPTSADIDRAYDALAHGIEDRVVTFSARHGSKKRERAYEAFHDVRHAKLIITTPRHAFLDRHDITTIIIEQSRSAFYKSRIRPYFDMREVLKTVARLTNRTVVLGDILPLAEDEHLRRSDIYLTENEHPKRLAFISTLKAIVQKDEPTASAPFELFSKALISAITSTVGKRKNVFLLAARRGLAPVVACADCGHIFRCPDSGTPYSLFKTTKNNEEQRWFLSTISGTRIRAADTCEACGSWRLRERGIGIQHIYDEMTTMFPDTPVILFDHTTATTYKKAQHLISSFYDAKGAILIGTPMVLPYLDQQVEQSAVVSLDATRAAPTWRIDEELLALLLTLRERTNDVVFVQTRSEIDTLLEYATRGLVDQFYTDEIGLRKALRYPPFSIFVHLTFTGSKAAVTELEQEIRNTVDPTDIAFYSAPHSTVSRTLRYGLIRVPRTAWPDPQLIERLRALPPQVRIEINPHQIV